MASSSSVYNLKSIQSPRLCGIILDIISRILAIPIIGRCILFFIKRQNKVYEVVQFANRCHACRSGEVPRPLVPLYYPIHDMTDEEEAMHREMVKESPINLKELSNNKQQFSEQEDGQFRHWTILDYTSRYTNRTVTPSEIIERIIRVIDNMRKEEHNKATIIVHMNIEELRKAAANSTERYQNGTTMGVLDGVPIAIKDEIPTWGFPCMFGGTSFLQEQEQPVTKDILPVWRLRQQGAIIIGKSNQHELGIGTTGFNRLHGTPKNPYGSNRNVHYYPGGSSSGSAVAVAMGLVPLAIGCDGGGSIRIPSSLCGIVGLKPTFKRIVFDSSMGWSVVHIGPMASSVHDAALAYAIMAGKGDDHRHLSHRQPPVHLHAYIKPNNSLNGLRIGIFEEHIADADTNVVMATKAAIDYYKSRGAHIIPITLPYLHETHLSHGITITSEMYSGNQQLFSNHFTELNPETRITIGLGSSWTASEFLAAQKVRSYAMNHIEDLFQNKVDVILSPATPCCAPILKDDVLSYGESNLSQTSALMRYIIHGNFTGIPAIVFPVAYDDDTALPISLQIQAAHWREDLLFHVAKESQDILRRHNGVAKPTRYVDILGGGKREN
jgi:Asp-tRNA(Asn)/Glu-tRNA(Gln) amidotransferase A subunit family amidase